MASVLRALSIVLLAAPLSLSIGCGGDGGGGNQGGDGGGGDGGDGGSGAGTSNGGSGAGASTSMDIDWAGTWSVDLDYHVACDVGFGNMKEGDNTHTNGIQVSKDGSGGFNASIDGYEMKGTGNAKGLTLSGQYPVQDYDKDTASNVIADNKITLKINTVVDADNATGTVEGTFLGQFGSECTISDGKATLYR